MGGNSGSKKKKEDTASPTTPYANAPTSQTFQPHLPGMQGLVASQLAQGFGSGGSGAPDFESMLANMYQPMSVFNFKEPISATAGAFDKAKFAPINTGNPILDKLLMGDGKSSSKDSKDRGDWEH